MLDFDDNGHQRMSTITITLKGFDKLTAALGKFREQIEKNMGHAGREAGDMILHSPGMPRNYPPGNHGPRPFVSDKQRRYFFWALKQGIIEVPYRRGQSPRSEKYGTQSYIEPRGYNRTAIGDRASYADILTGDKQSPYMAAGGWRKLIDVAQEKIGEITTIFQGWVDRTIRDLRL